MESQTLKSRIRLWLILFIAALIVSGLTAIPLEWELGLLDQIVRAIPAMPPALIEWIAFVKTGLEDTYRQYPFMAYGTDWLAFAHIAIAVAFIGPLRDPVKNIWVIEFGLIACALVVPTALLFGSLRGIPFFWQLIDCSFGVFGFIPLWVCRRDIRRIEQMEKRAI